MVQPRPDRRNSQDPQEIHHPKCHDTQPDIPLLDPLQQQTYLHEESQIQDRVRGNERMDDPSKQAVVRIQPFVRQLCDFCDRTAKRFDTEKIVHR